MYRIEYNDSETNRHWTTDGIGDGNKFDAEAEALDALRQLVDMFWYGNASEEGHEEKEWREGDWVWVFTPRWASREEYASRFRVAEIDEPTTLSYM